MGTTTGLTVRITHPFHPLKDQTFEVISRSLHWGEDRVIYRAADGTLPTIAAAMTDMERPDTFRRVAAGRAALIGTDRSLRNIGAFDLKNARGPKPNRNLCQVKPDHSEAYTAATATRPTHRLALQLVNIKKFTLWRCADDRPRKIMHVLAGSADRLKLLIIGQVANPDILLPAFHHQKSSAEGIRV